MPQSKSPRISETLIKKITTIITVHTEHPMLLLPIIAHLIGFNRVNSMIVVSSAQETLVTATAIVSVIPPETLKFRMDTFKKTKLTT